MAAVAADADRECAAMRALTERGRTAGAARAAKVRERVAVRAGRVAGVTVAVEGDAVVLSGRGLARRSITDPAFAQVAEWGR
ncbi:hypothetical protein ASE78_11865 [Sphingomonas sp. Leaf25]|nr:hypothetical protein ASE78_11865 [Sphingomonas sp. Leaf25]